MKTIEYDKLEAAANHLLTGKLGHDKFNIVHFNQGSEDANVCGTSGCMVGEFPIIWPSVFRFASDNHEGKHILFINDSSESTERDVMNWLNISHWQYTHLFYSTCQRDEYGGIELSNNATKEQVANNILEFIKIMKEREHGI